MSQKEQAKLAEMFIEGSLGGRYIMTETINTKIPFSIFEYKGVQLYLWHKLPSSNGMRISPLADRDRNIANCDCDIYETTNSYARGSIVSLLFGLDYYISHLE